MSKKLNFIVITMIFALPILMFYLLKTPNSSISSQSIAASTRPTVIKFSTRMCSDCQKLKATMEEVTPAYSGKINFEELDVQSNDANIQQLATKYKVKVVPTVVYINKSGKAIRVTEGSMPKEQLKKYLDELLNG